MSEVCPWDEWRKEWKCVCEMKSIVYAYLVCYLKKIVFTNSFILIQDDANTDEVLSDHNSGSDHFDDVDASLQKEVKALKKSRANKNRNRFSQVNSGVNNVLFIRTTLPDPNRIVDSIFSDVLDSGKGQSRFIMRFMPVLNTCRADAEKIKALAQTVLKPFFGELNEDGHSYAVMFKARNSNLIGSSDVQELIWKVVIEMSIKNRVDLTTPEYVIHVNIMRTICCMSVLNNYKKYSKYNLQELTSSKSSRTHHEEHAGDKPVVMDESKEEQGNTSSLGEDITSKNNCVDNIGDTVETDHIHNSPSTPFIENEKENSSDINEELEKTNKHNNEEQ